MIGQAKRLFELNEIYNKSHSNNRECPIIAFTSGKGGTGKSFLTLNTAFTLAGSDKKVLVVDLDLNLSNLNLFLNIYPQHSIGKYFRDQNLLNEIIYEYDENIDFIFGDSGQSDYPDIKEMDVVSLFNDLNNLSENYDYILLDTSAGASKVTLEILNQSDTKILVSTPEPTAVMDAYVITKLLKSKNKTASFDVIFNKCLKPEDGKRAIENLNNATKHFLKTQNNFLGTIEYSEEVSKSIIEQELYCNTYKNSRITDQINTLAKKIIKNSHLANSNH